MKNKKTKLWNVWLKANPTTNGEKYSIVCSENKPTNAVRNSLLQIRTIQASAAVRRYVKNNLSSILYENEDGGNDASDLKPKELKKLEKKKSHRHMLYDDAGNIATEYR